MGRPDAYATQATRIRPTHCIPTTNHREDQIVEQRSSRKGKELRVEHVSFPSSVAEGVQEDRPQLIPQMSTTRRRDGGGRRAGALRVLLLLILILVWLNLTMTLTGTISRRGPCVYSSFFRLTCLKVFSAFFTAIFVLLFFFNIQSIDSAHGLAFCLAGDCGVCVWCFYLDFEEAIIPLRVVRGAFYATIMLCRMP